MGVDVEAGVSESRGEWPRAEEWETEVCCWWKLEPLSSMTELPPCCGTGSRCFPWPHPAKSHGQVPEHPLFSDGRVVFSWILLRRRGC